MKLSDYVMNFLYKKNIRHIFGFQGGSVTHLIDSIHKIDELAYIQNYHEQASSFCADAYARASGNVGVAVATSGPGATNLITGIANAFFDSVPCLFITGQVSVHAMKTNPAVRQQGFQETDIVSIVQPVTKFAKTLLEPENIRYDLEKAFYLAQTGRPGPVLIDLPHNVQASEINSQTLKSFTDSDEYILERKKHREPDCDTVKRIVAMLAEAERPVILAGGGMASVRGRGIFETVVHACDLPVVCSLRGLDAINHDDSHFCGFIGSYGNRYANFAVAKSDLLLVLGSRLDERQTGDDRTMFARGAKIVHVDIDPHELNHNLSEAVSVLCDIESFLKKLMVETGGRTFDHRGWLDQIRRWKAKYPSYPALADDREIDPNEFMQVLSGKVSGSSVVCADVGQNMMWVAQSFGLNGHKQLLCSAGHGAMGYSLPAGIGAYFASPERPVICITGDGGVQMNVQELQTVSREKIPMKIFIMNNQSLGMIRTFHEKYFNRRCFGSARGYANPDFEKLAYAYDILYTKIRSREDFNRIDHALEDKRPHLVEVMLSPETQVVPEPAPRRPVEDQLPLLDRKEFDRLLDMEDIALKDEKI